MDQKTVEDYLRTMPDARQEFPYGEEVAVYKVGEEMFALVTQGKDPARLSLRCDPQLAQSLREEYETVMPGERLDKKHWNTLILSGQLPWEEVQALIQHSYQLATA